MIDLKHPMNQDVTNAIKVLRSQNEQLFIIPQNLIEFWNVGTRPLEKNGLGMTVSETEREISRMENYPQQRRGLSENQIFVSLPPITQSRILGGKVLKGVDFSMAGGGIEPPTRGFSV